MAEAEQDKSEQATPFKLQRARERGAVAKGADLGFFTGTTAFLGYAWIAGPSAVSGLGQAVRKAFVTGMNAAGDASVLAVVSMLFSAIVRPLLMMVGAVFVIVLLFEVLQTGIVFSAQPLKPDFSRLNPATGIKRLFSLRLLLETFKNVLKICAYVTVAWLVIRGRIGEVSAAQDGRTLFFLMMRSAGWLLAAFAGVALLFAGLDQLISRKDFLKKMRMSRRELRREMRDREGDPRLKSKRKQLHSEFAKQSRSLKNLRGADVLIVNPEHIAVALRYDRNVMTAPVVASVGADHLAQRLKRLAMMYGIPVIEDRPLARALYRHAMLDRQIPESFYSQVAAIYRNRLAAKPPSGAEQ